MRVGGRGECEGAQAQAAQWWPIAFAKSLQSPGLGWPPLGLRSTRGLGPPPSPAAFGLAGERQLPQHQLGDPYAGPAEREAALVPATATADGAQQKVPWLLAQQLPQPTALLAAALPAQRQGQHLPGERECPTPERVAGGQSAQPQGPSEGCSRCMVLTWLMEQAALCPSGFWLGLGPPGALQPLSLYSELLYQLLLLEGDSVHPVEPRPSVTFCPCQLH